MDTAASIMDQQRSSGPQGCHDNPKPTAAVSRTSPDTTLCTQSSCPSSSSCDQPSSTNECNPNLTTRHTNATAPPGSTVPSFLDGLPGYKIRRLVGNGSFGVVYSAKCLQTNERVAIKSLDKLRISKRSSKKATSPSGSPSSSVSGNHDGFLEATVTNFTAECSFLRHLVPPHPNIIRLIDVVETDLVLHMVMEYLPRGDLHKQLAGFGAYKEEDARPLFAQLVSAVGYLHEKGWIHRDIKLDNVLLTNDGTQIRLCDFGLTVRYSWTAPLKSFAGSPPFAAPEVHFGWLFFGPEADIWSLGVVLYTMLTSSLPFDGKDFKSLRQAIWQANPKLPSTLSMESVQLLRACFARNPAQRTDVGLVRDSHWLQGMKLASPSVAIHESLRPSSAPHSTSTSVLAPITLEQTNLVRGRHALRVTTTSDQPPPAPSSIRGRSLGPMSAGPIGPSDPVPSSARPRAKSTSSESRQLLPTISQLGAPTGILGSQMGSWLGLSGFTDKMAGMRLGILHGSLMRLMDGVVGNKSAAADDDQDLIALPVSMQSSARSRSRSRVRSSAARNRSPATGSRSMDALHEHEDEMEGGGSRPLAYSLGSLDALGHTTLEQNKAASGSLDMERSEGKAGHDAFVPLPMASGIHWFFPVLVMFIGVLFSLAFGSK